MRSVSSSRSSRHPLLPVLASVAGCLVLAATGCTPSGAESSRGASPGQDSSAASAAADAGPGWGPTETELAEARRIVGGWDADRLAGQMIVAGYAGSDPATPARLVRELHLAGIALNGGNVAGADQVRATARAVAAAAREDGRSFPPVVATDQEGGIVEHLRGIAASYPPFSAAGHAVTDPRGGRPVVRRAMRAAGLELRWLGVNWVLGPVGDVTIGAGDPTIGSRSASSNPRVAAQATAAAVRGYRAAGVVSTVKHFPGHGSVTADSHVVLPHLDSSLAELERRDLKPFRASVDAGAPVVMLAHVDVRALAPGRPSSLAPRVYRYLREELGFEGVAMTDALEMGAVATHGQDPALAALRAGADLVLIPPDTRAAHAAVAAAIRDGRLPRGRAVASVTRIVALQLWQQRRSAAVPVGPASRERARSAAQRLATFR